MIKELKEIFFAIAAIISIAAISSAYPIIPTYDPGGIPSITSIAGQYNPDSTSTTTESNNTISGISNPNSIFGNRTATQTPTDIWHNESWTSSELEHPAQGPQAEIPASEPSANTGNVVPAFGEKQVLVSQDIVAYFGSEPQSASVVASDQAPYANDLSFNPYYSYSSRFLSSPKFSGIKMWALYNRIWTMEPSAAMQFQEMNLLVKNNRLQNLWGYDSNSLPQWTFWGYMGPGFIPSAFYADTKGWHMCSIWGSVSGFSNTLPIFVW
jgi:hypothetical protein